MSEMGHFQTKSDAYRCASIGLILLQELTFWSTRNVGATISDAASPVDEIEKLKARHAAEIERIVEVAQKTVNDLVEQATEEANRRLEELTSENERLRALVETVAPYREQIKKFDFTEAQAIDQLCKWEVALAGPVNVRAFRALMHSHGVRPEDVTPETQARVSDAIVGLCEPHHTL
jgi:cell division septum initiation protein DivIVA